MSAEGVPVAREPFWPEGHPLHADALRAWGPGGYSKQSILSNRPPSAFKCFAQGYVAGREDAALPASTADAREGALEKCVEALAECLSWMRCDCGHPACKRCPATKDGDEALALAAKSGGGK